MSRRRETVTKSPSATVTKPPAKVVMGGSLKLSIPTLFAHIPEWKTLNAAYEAAGFKLSRAVVVGEITRSLHVRFSISWKAGRHVVRREKFTIPLWAFAGRAPEAEVKHDHP